MQRQTNGQPEQARENFNASPCKVALVGSLYSLAAKGMVSDFYYHVWRYTKTCVSVSIN
jgi:hypothetical protein